MNVNATWIINKRIIVVSNFLAIFNGMRGNTRRPSCEPMIEPMAMAIA